jgi:hypothetical protein
MSQYLLGKRILAICTAFLLPFFGMAQAPNTISLPIKGKEGEIILRFVYCPEGVLVEVDQSLKESGKTGLKPFYFLETEVTIAEYRALLGKAGMNDILEVIPKNMNGDIVDTYTHYVAQINNKHSKWPAPFVKLKNAMEICKLSNDSINDKKVKSLRSLDEYVIRIPTIQEWQYAGRGAVDAKEGAMRLHFNQWINNVPESIIGSGTELRKKLDLLGSFDGSQAQLLDMIEKSEKFVNEIRSLTNEILPLAFSKDQKLEGWINSATGSITLHDVKFLKPSNWGIYGIHFNTPELVINADQKEATDIMNDYIVDTKNLDNIKGKFTLAGPYSGASLSGKSNFSSFTLSGFQHIPDRKRENIDALVFEATTGVRLVMDRQLVKNYVSILRENWYNAIYKKDIKIASMMEKLKTISELSNEGDETFLIYNIYNAIAENKKDECKKALETAGAKWGKKKINLSALDFNSEAPPKPAPTANPPTLSEEGAFFTLFASR